VTRGEHARRKGRSSSQLLRPEKRQRIYARDGWRCQWCRRHISEGAKLTIDHFLPRALGGDNATDNLITACDRCNYARADRPAFAFLYVRCLQQASEAGRRLAAVVQRKALPLPRYVP
jgi:5-methylcytosine-specific restriction endonuclease McrA